MNDKWNWNAEGHVQFHHTLPLDIIYLVQIELNNEVCQASLFEKEIWPYLVGAPCKSSD